MTRLDLSGLDVRPAQVWGAVRLVPLVRDEPVEDLRLHVVAHHGAQGPVEDEPSGAYLSYVPHGFVATWTGDGRPAAAYGTQIFDGDGDFLLTMSLGMHGRMSGHQMADRTRFLPLYLALEGYLALHFGGPMAAWEEWSARAVRQGLAQHVEEAYVGAEVHGLADALRVFEIHPGQCGGLLYVADTLAAAFAVPHPDDYRALHTTLVQDLYGELIHHHATLMPPVPDFLARIPDTDIRSLADLRAAATEQEHAWVRFHHSAMAAGLLEHPYTWQRVTRIGRFTLSRFLPRFRPKQENHIGEVITDHRGRLVYLKTFRLSESLVRRGHLLSGLAAHDWHLARTAAGFGISEAHLGLRLESAGFGFLLREDMRERYRSQARGRRR